KNFQGCITVYLSMYNGTLLKVTCAVSYATAYLEYHMLFALSTAFLNYFLLPVEACFLCFVYLSNESEYITPIVLCQHLFFVLFKHFLQFVFDILSMLKSTLPTFDKTSQKLYNSFII
ncbi:MAG: hypothetical protein IKJ39_05660, partial [Lachnospiraceae bacterium]|nr:hypothetical protein [Lachnospiraceae bacterium]